MARRLERTGSRQTPLWRRLIGCALAYALAVQGVLFALSSAQLAASAATDATQRIELCLHDPADATNLPAGDHDSKLHCPFCLAAGQHVLAAPHVGLLLIVADAGRGLVRSEALQRAKSSQFRSHQPRGPPPSA
jgi:hypothetical protein